MKDLNISARVVRDREAHVDWIKVLNNKSNSVCNVL